MANPSEEEDKGAHEPKGSECSGSRSCHRAILLVLSVVGEKRKRSLPKEVPQEGGKKSGGKTIPHPDKHDILFRKCTLWISKFCCDHCPALVVFNGLRSLSRCQGADDHSGWGEEVTAPGFGYGNWNCSGSPMNSPFPSGSTISRQEQASGTKSSIDCFHTLVSTGGVSPWSVTRSLST